MKDLDNHIDTMLSAAFEASATPTVLADAELKVTKVNRAFEEYFEAHEDAFLDCFGEESAPSEVVGQPVDLYLEGTGYRRALRKASSFETAVDVNGTEHPVRVSTLVDGSADRIGFSVEWVAASDAKEAPTSDDIVALGRVIDGIAAASSREEAARSALVAVKEAFGWAYGSFWAVDPEGRALRFVVDAGRVNDEFHRVTAEASFEEGVGLSGRTWRARELVFVEDLGQMVDCCRRESAQRAGVKSGVCFPVMAEGRVVGTMDFFTTEVLQPSEQRLETLRMVGRMVSHALESLGQAERQKEVAREARSFASAVDCSSNPLMLVDEDLVIRYINRAARDMLAAQEATLRDTLPGFSVDALVGTCIDDFHKNPAHQRRILADPRSFPYRTRVKIAALTFDLVVNAMMEDGEMTGLVAEWRDVSAEVLAQEKIAQLLEAATEGRISERLDHAGWRGFTQDVGQGMNELLDAVQQPLDESKRVIQALARGDLTQSASEELRGEFAEVADALNASIGNLRGVIGRIVASGASIGQAASELAEGNADLNGRTQQQAAALEETAATVEELTGTVKQNAENAQEANKLASDARGLAERGGEVVGRAVSAMSEINRASKKISDIIGVIDEIAFQTNLLALNAAVEAARAGEQGRGFAVVATEVRNLAQRSAGAAKEIKALIKDSVEKVEDGSRLVDSSGQTLQEIVGGVTRVSEIIAEIAAASEEQAAGIEQVNKAVAQMDEMTQQNAAMVEEAAAASSSMHQQAQSLSELVARFELGASSGEPVAAPPPPSRGAGSAGAPVPAAPATVPHPVAMAPSAAADDWDEF